MGETTAWPVGPATHPETPLSFDYVIVGAGSAGAPLAGRLSEDPSTRVALLEAGPDYRAAEAPREMAITNPFGIMSADSFPEYQWPTLVARRTERQRPSPYWRGRGLGGGSIIHGLVAVRPTPDDAAAWVALGCSGWSWDDLLPALSRLEDDLDFGTETYHGQDGPVPIHRSHLSRWGAVDLALRSAAVDLGYGWADDHNAPGESGVSPFAMSSRGGARGVDERCLPRARPRSPEPGDPRRDARRSSRVRG